MNNNPITAEQLNQLVNQVARFTVPKKLKINRHFLDILIKDGAIKVNKGTATEFGILRGIPMVEDDSVATFEFEY